MNEPEDFDATAAEYVLGTLSADERAAVAARRRGEPKLDTAIAEWERRLAPLDELVPDVPPSPVLLGKIEARLDSQSTTASGLAVDHTRDKIVLLEKRVTFWRRTSVAASLMAACLALVVGLRETWFPPKPLSFVAVFQKDDALPSFLLTIDLSTRELTIRPVAARPQPDKTYQLWILAEPLGPAPRSLGLLEEADQPTRKTLTSFEPALLQKATFGISVEPPGGSPTGRPTGPALHGKLYPATP